MGVITRSWSALPDRPGDVVHWAPDRVLPDASSMPKLPLSWDAYFASTDCPYISAAPLLRTMVSIGLSMPLTILDALQRFSVELSSISSKMVIHVLGAQMDFEMKYGGMAFEEIMHQLPRIKELVVHFVGPETGAMDADEIPMSTCQICSRTGKTRTYRMSKYVWL
jgi:splicing suppressor protein 51